jgi:GNAT superfamily N-acetyltransferase
VIRPAERRDCAAILGLVHALADYERSPESVVATEPDLAAALFGDRPAAFAHVVEVDGAVVGMALWFLSYSTWTGRHGLYVEDLFVQPAHRRQGWGRRLLETLAAICVERGYSRLEWAVLDWNAPAIAFYRSLGAEAMDEWTVNRMAGPALGRLGAG